MKLRELQEEMMDKAMPYLREYGLSGASLELHEWVKQNHPDQLELVMATDEMMERKLAGETEIPDRYLKYVTETP